MDILERVVQLQRLVKAAGGEVVGRKKLQKVAYLCQYDGTDLGQTFVFHMYGVYAPSLAQDLRAAVRWQLLEEEHPKEEPYVIRVPQNPAYSSSGAGDPAWNIVRELAGQSATMLEVLSTIVYLWDIEFRGKKLNDSLLKLKPHLKQYFGHAFRLAEQHFAIRVDGA